MWTIELYDQVKNTTYDISAQSVAFNASKQLDSGVNSFVIHSFNIYDYHKKNLITIKKDGVVKFKGIVINQYDSQQSGVKMTTLECADNGFILGRRLVAEIYTSVDSTQGLPSKIIKDLITNYLAASGFTSNHVTASSASIITTGDVLEFPYIYAQDAVDRIMEHLTDWHYYVDNDRDFHFFYRYEDAGDAWIHESKYYPENSCILKDTLSINTIGDEEFNRVWIIGAKKAAEQAIDQFFTGDGSQRYFNLSYEPYDLKVYVNGVEKDVMNEESDDGTADFLLDDSERVLYIPTYKTPWSGTIKANYKPAKQIIDKFENPGSIDEFGLYEKIIKDSDIASRSSARKIGLAEIRRQSVIRTVLNFQTRRELLLGYAYYVEILADGKNPDGSISLNVWNLKGNYVVKEISIDVTPEDTIYTVTMEELL